MRSSPLQHRNVRNEPTWRPLVRASLDFSPSDYDPVLEVCQQWIARTYENCFGRPISNQILASSNNDFRPPGFCFSWLSIDKPADQIDKLFSAKIEHPDSEAARTWSIEFEIAKTQDKVIFGIRTAVFGQDIHSAPQSVPRLIKELSRRGASQAGIPLAYSGAEITSREELQTLVNFVNHPDRVAPLIVVTELPDADGWPVDVQSVAKNTQGIAVVVSMRNDITYLWRELMPSRLNVFGGATRVYLPQNRGYLYAPIRIPREDLGEASEGVEAWAVRTALESSIKSPVWIDRHSNFETARQILARQQRLDAISASRKSNNVDAMAAMYEEEINSLTAELERERTESRVWAGELQEWQDKFTELESANRSLLYQLEQASNKSKSGSIEQKEEKEEFPASLSELRAWYERSPIKERLYITSKAIRAGEDSEYEKPEHVYVALDILGNQFFESKKIGANAASAKELELALNKAGLHLEFAGSNITLKSKDYRVDYDGRKLTTDLHLTRGGGRDPRYCMRVYFCWDEKTQKCIVGWMPSHLDNSLT